MTTPVAKNSWPVKDLKIAVNINKMERLLRRGQAIEAAVCN